MPGLYLDVSEEGPEQAGPLLVCLLVHGLLIADPGHGGVEALLQPSPVHRGDGVGGRGVLVTIELGLGTPVLPHTGHQVGQVGLGGEVVLRRKEGERKYCYQY